MNELPLARELLSHREALLQFIRSRGVAEADAEDVLHDSLLKAIRGAPDLRDTDRLTSWLYQITRHAIADHFRRIGRSPQLADGDVLQEHPSPEEHRMICQCVIELMGTLSSGYREVVEAIDLRGESTTSTAARLGISRNNLKVRLHRARNQLRDRLEETCRTCAEHGCLDCACRM